MMEWGRAHSRGGLQGTGPALGTLLSRKRGVGRSTTVHTRECGRSCPLLSPPHPSKRKTGRNAQHGGEGIPALAPVQVVPWTAAYDPIGRPVFNSPSPSPALSNAPHLRGLWGTAPGAGWAAMSEGGLARCGEQCEKERPSRLEGAPPPPPSRHQRRSAGRGGRKRRTVEEPRPRSFEWVRGGTRETGGRGGREAFLLPLRESLPPPLPRTSSSGRAAGGDCPTGIEGAEGGGQRRPRLLPPTAAARCRYRRRGHVRPLLPPDDASRRFRRRPIRDHSPSHIARLLGDTRLSSHVAPW